MRAEKEDALVGDALIELRAALKKAAGALESLGLISADGRAETIHGDLRTSGRSGSAARSEFERRLAKTRARAAALETWFDEFFDHRLVLPELPPSAPRAFRTFLLERFVSATSHAGHGLPKALGDCFVEKDNAGTRSLPSHVDLALVSLLCGEFPFVSSDELKAGISEEEIRDLEADALRKARGHVLWRESASVTGSNEMARAGMGYDFSALYASPSARSPSAARKKKKR